MPTNNKRINLSVPEEIYNRIQNYRKRFAIPSDAGACLQLIVRQLDNIDKSDELMELVSRFKPEELKTIAGMGIDSLVNLKGDIKSDV